MLPFMFVWVSSQKTRSRKEAQSMSHGCLNVCALCILLVRLWVVVFVVYISLHVGKLAPLKAEFTVCSLQYTN